MGAAVRKQRKAPAKCRRETCNFVRHTKQRHGYCCYACKMSASHGPACELVVNQTSDATNSSSTKGKPGGSRSNLCARQNCIYLAHTNQDHGFCCWACKNHGTHGPACKAALAQQPLQQSLTAEWLPSLTFGPKSVGTDCTGITATETMHLEVHQGQLFSSFGKWMSPEFVKKKWDKMENFIGRLDSAGGKWVVDMQGQHGSRFATRITCLKSVVWTRDCNGQPLQPPVTQLVALYGLGPTGNFMLFRDDHQRAGGGGTQHVWRQAKYADAAPRGEAVARAVAVHRDSVTGVDLLFALQGYRGVVTAVYDPASANPGHAVWGSAPEKLDLSSVGNASELTLRPLSLLCANGRIYMSSGAYILHRVDGPDPVWRVLVDVTARSAGRPLHNAVGGIRGMTAVPSPGGGTNSSILFCWNPDGSSKAWILRADLPEGGGATVEEETSVVSLAAQYLGQPDLHYSIAAYNNMLRVNVANQACNLIGFQLRTGPQRSGTKIPLDPGQVHKNGGYWAGGGFAVRKGPSEYEIMEVGGRRSSSAQAAPVLTAVRTYIQSPFAEEPDTVYFGGYDCNSSPSEHTAWIYKGSFAGRNAIPDGVAETKASAT